MDSELIDVKPQELKKVDDQPQQMQISPDASPMVQIAQMMQAGLDIDVDKMAKLQEISEKYEANEARKAYHVAMAAFKLNPPQIFKDKNVGYGNTSYSHASLGKSAAIINAALSRHGLTASWKTERLENGNLKVTCFITHALGHSESTWMDSAPDSSGKKNPIQSLGSTKTYLERYTLFAITGLAADDMDDDGNGGPNVDTTPQVRQVSETEKEIITSICGALPPKEGFTPNFDCILGICIRTSRDYLVPEYVGKIAEHLTSNHTDDVLYIPIPAAAEDEIPLNEEEQPGHFGP